MITGIMGALADDFEETVEEVDLGVTGGCRLRVVGRDDEPGARGSTIDERGDNVERRRVVELPGGLVGEYPAWGRGQRTRDADALEFAARE